MSTSDRGAERSRTLIVHKDDAGYGLTLSGDKPTRVQTVKDGGASDRAGVRPGDVIIKVNGQQVTESSHTDVVQLIQTGSYVALTVINSSRFTNLGSSSSRRESITGPSPADTHTEKQMHTEKMHTLQLMIEEKTREVEELRSSLARNNSKKIKKKLDDALKNLQDLEYQQSFTKQSPERTLTSSAVSFVNLPPAAPPRPDSSLGAVSSPPALPPRNKVDTDQETAPELPSRISNSSLPPPVPRHSQSSLGLTDGQKSPRYETPPGTPPPPYIIGTSDSWPPAIINMESDSDDNMDDTGAITTFTLPVDGDHGPFNSLQELKQHPAHLAVFLNYVILQDDPNPLLFFLITDAYKSGTVKEMRKWAYEIHSCFLVPKSPLELPHLDENIINNIDKLLSDTDNPEQLNQHDLQKVFFSSRSKARDVLKFQLDDFRAKRAQGLGNIYGPPDSELKLSDENPEKRMHVINERLVPLLETMAEDLDNATDEKATLCSSLASVMLKIFNTRDPKVLSLVEKVPTFVTKEKKRDKLFSREKQKLKHNGHHFVLKHYDQLTYCTHSQQIIWGIGPQGYQCSNCGFDVCKKWVNKVEEGCVGPSDKKRKSLLPMLPLLNNAHRAMSKEQLTLPELSRPNKSVSPSFRDRPESDNSFSVPGLGGQEDVLDAGSGDLSKVIVMDNHTPLMSPNNNQPSSVTSSPKGVRRSVSARTGGAETPRANNRRGANIPRKLSDPMSLQHRRIRPMSLDGDSVSGGSSDSEFRSWDPSPLTPRLSLLPRQDSDVDTDQVDPPDWRNSLTADQLASLSSRESKRQDVINELFHTEKNHVRNLKVLERVFRLPLLESGLMPKEVVDRLFPNLDEVIQIHSSYNNAMTNLKRGGFPINDVGDVLRDMFLGSFGERLIIEGAEFTKNQKFTLEELKRIRQRDSRVDQKLQELESDSSCRRLKLEDMLAWEHQRLVKYPLLLKEIAKHMEDHNEEYELIKEVEARTKEILENIDKEVAEAQNIRKLEEIQKSLDTSGLEKLGPENQVCLDYRNVDLTKLKLIYDGQLTLNLGGENRRVKNIDLYVLLLDDCVMFLQKQDEKYLLKFHTVSGGIPGNRDDVKKILSPVIKFSTMIVRPVATNKKAFYLMNTTQMGAQLYELQATHNNEVTTWLNHIEEATTAYKRKDHRFRPTHSASNLTFVQNRQQMFEGNMDMTDRRGSGLGPPRSQSFNEQSLRNRELSNRPLPSIPIEREPETLESKIEKLSRKDEEVAKALEEKQKIIADIFNIPPEDYETITDLVIGTEDRKDAKDVLLAVMAQADSLAKCVNECLKVSEMEPEPKDREVRLATPPSDKLVSITTNMNTNLTSLLSILQDQEEEKQTMRRELLASQEQMRSFITGTANDSSTYRSRPESYISVESDVECVNEAMGSSSAINNSTPINEINIDSEDSASGGERNELVVDIGEISEDMDKDIVESSDC